MSDQEWDADDFDPDAATVPAVSATDKWMGEDEDDDIKDNWDDEEAEENADNTVTATENKKKKKSLKEILAEKEQKKRQEMEERKRQEEEAKRKMTPEEMLEEKLRQQKLVEESDLLLAREALGVDTLPAAGEIDSLDPISKEDFDKLSKLICDKLKKSEKSTHYVTFLESMFRDLILDLDVEEIRKLSSSLTAIYNEKNRAQKSTKSKKKGKAKSSLNSGKDNNFDDYTAGALDDYDDFM